MPILIWEGTRGWSDVFCDDFIHIGWTIDVVKLNNDLRCLVSFEKVQEVDQMYFVMISFILDEQLMWSNWTMIY